MDHIRHVVSFINALSMQRIPVISVFVSHLLSYEPMEPSRTAVGSRLSRNSENGREAGGHHGKTLNSLASKEGTGAQTPAPAFVLV